ncbi:MAG: exosortase H-associated membrane protein [Thermodesulfobacteriota bacterium]
MDNQQKRSLRLNRSVIIKTAIIFIASYAVFLGIWLALPIENYYGLLITKVASNVIALIKGLDITEIVMNKDIVTVGFIPNQVGLTQIIKTTIDVPTGNYAFNVPLTLAIMAAFYPFIKSKWLYLEALVILVVVHFLFVFSLEGQKITAVFDAQGFRQASSFSIIFWEFLWGFVDNMVVRFEPFLIGAYLFLLRNRVRTKKVKPEKVVEKKAPRQPQRKKKPKRKR